MKKLLFAIALIASFTSLNAQTEIKINPIGAIFANPDLSVEFGVADDIGIEPSIGFNYLSLKDDSGSGFKSSGFGYGVNGKYYFGPSKGLDKFHAGIYVRGGQSKFTGSSSDNTSESFSRSRLGAGISLGYKWVSRKNVVFELNGGLGRKIFNKFSNTQGGVNTSGIPILNFDGFFKFNVGYRFGGGKTSRD